MKHQDFYTEESANELHESLKTVDEVKHIQTGEAAALKLLHQMAERVPAYSDFLKKNNVDHNDITSIEDFEKVPLIDKDNYLRQYPRDMLMWDGEFKNKDWVISSTSGSSGKPYYFPRQSLQDQQYAMAADLYLRSNFKVHERSTLYIVAFPMGAWIGGLFTYEAIKMVAETRGYPLSVITPGIHKTEILNAIKELSGDFDQILIGSYAPFLKDFLEDGEKQGIDWKSLNVNFIFSAEVFSETFRDYVQQKAALTNVNLETLNHYGTVDLGTMAHETPASIAVRRQAVDDARLFEKLFNQTTHLPTFAQYVPEMFYFEVVDGNNLVCSANSGIPLVRYDLKDRGGIITQQQLRATLDDSGYSFDKMIVDNELEDTVWNLPYVYVYERSDFSVSFYAFQVYPQTIRKALQQDSLIRRVTGKFTMRVRYDDNGQQLLEIDVECSGSEQPSTPLQNEVTQTIKEQLIEENSEYRELYRHYGDNVLPTVNLWPYEDEKYFRVGAKQNWVDKDQRGDREK